MRGKWEWVVKTRKSVHTSTSKFLMFLIPKTTKVSKKSVWMARLNTLWKPPSSFNWFMYFNWRPTYLHTYVFRSVFRFLTFLQVFRRCSSGFSSISSLDSLSKIQEYYCTQSQIFCLHSVAILIEETWPEVNSTKINERQISSADCFVLTKNFTERARLRFYLVTELQLHCQLLSQLKL